MGRSRHVVIGVAVGALMLSACGTRLSNAAFLQAQRGSGASGDLSTGDQGTTAGTNGSAGTAGTQTAAGGPTGGAAAGAGGVAGRAGGGGGGGGGEAPPATRPATSG
ncbi:MAG: hypothetical protein E6G01_01360 [Actinobacteria bacterium]|nr:MAG: hypothetical protein E6G01_01360 [Actinomycetota bacterium]